jgi:hypothetical protein
VAALLAASPPLHAGREQARSCRRLRRRFDKSSRERARSKAGICAIAARRTPGGFAAASCRSRASSLLQAASPPFHAGREQARSCRRLRRRFMPVAGKLAPTGGFAAVSCRSRASSLLWAAPLRLIWPLSAEKRNPFSLPAP